MASSSRLPRRVGLIAAALGLVMAVSDCRARSGEANKKIEPIYDKDTGRLQLLKYDANGNGKTDTWSYMDAARIVRIEIDKNEDGRIDRWEYYGTDGKLEKVGLSRAGDGKIDSWAYYGAAGSLARTEVLKDGTVVRTDFYEKGMVARATEDTDGDGRVDKWETYDGHRLASVAFDLTHSGRPERRLVYAPDGSVRLEVDRGGTGVFVPAPPAASGRKYK